MNCLRYWQLLYNVGARQAPSRARVKEVRTLNKTALLSFLLVCGSGVNTYLLLPNHSYYLFFFAFALLFLVTLPLNYWRQYEWAKAATYLVGNFIIFWCCATFGIDSDAHFLYILVVLGTVLNFDPRDLRMYVLIVLLPIASLAILYLSDFAVFPQAPAATPEQYRRESLVSFVSGLGLAFILARLFIRDNQRSFRAVKRANEVLKRKNQELQKLNAEMDRFVYSVSHDLRAPVASVLGLIEIGKLETSIETLQSYLVMQERSMKRLDGFIRDVLDHTRNTRLEPAYAPVDLQALLRESLELQHANAELPHVQQRVEVEQTAPFWGDGQRLGVVLNNLLSNAFRYANPASESPWLRAHLRADARTLGISVTDNGLGIGAAQLPHIFEMFYVGTERKRGSGLGLYIVKETVEKLGGSIAVESTPGQGTCFMLTLPNHAPAVPAPAVMLKMATA